MTPSLRRAGAAVLAAAVLTSPLAAAHAAAPARADAKNFGTVVKLDGAKLQACKQLNKAGTAFRVYVRVDNSGNRDFSVRGYATAYRSFDIPKSRSYDSGNVRPGKVSAAGYVVYTKGSDDVVELTIAGGESGNGGRYRIADIKKTC